MMFNFVRAKTLINMRVRKEAKQNIISQNEKTGREREIEESCLLVLFIQSCYMRTQEFMAFWVSERMTFFNEIMALEQQKSSIVSLKEFWDWVHFSFFWIPEFIAHHWNIFRVVWFVMFRFCHNKRWNSFPSYIPSSRASSSTRKIKASTFIMLVQTRQQQGNNNSNWKRNRKKLSWLSIKKNWKEFLSRLFRHFLFSPLLFAFKSRIFVKFHNMKNISHVHNNKNEHYIASIEVELAYVSMSLIASPAP